MGLDRVTQTMRGRAGGKEAGCPELAWAAQPHGGVRADRQRNTPVGRGNTLATTQAFVTLCYTTTKGWARHDAKLKSQWCRPAAESCTPHKVRRAQGGSPAGLGAPAASRKAAVCVLRTRPESYSCAVPRCAACGIASSPPFFASVPGTRTEPIPGRIAMLVHGCVWGLAPLRRTLGARENPWTSGGHAAVGPQPPVPLLRRNRRNHFHLPEWSHTYQGVHAPLTQV